MPHARGLKSLFLAAFLAFPGVAAIGQESPKVLVLPGERLKVEGHSAFIFWPAEGKRSTPQPWVMYAPTLAGYPDTHEKWMHEQFVEAGIAVAGVDVGEAYGSPKGRAGMTALYRELTEKRGFSTRPVLLGRSRGGLWVSSWAEENPENVAGIAGIYPVFDFTTYPGLSKAAPAYGLTESALKEKAAELNPVARAEILAKKEIPVFIIHGDVDKVVPLKENSAALVEAYRKAGKSDLAQLMVVKGQGHNFWEGFFRCQELVDFVVARAKAKK
ncbi:MAG: prolyl oligopeptidase family serine peptidase [Isosphaeraceae bacterium]